MSPVRQKNPLRLGLQAVLLAFGTDGWRRACLTYLLVLARRESGARDRPREERANTVFAIQRSGTYSERNDLTRSRQIVKVALVKAEALVPLTVKNARGQHQ